MSWDVAVMPRVGAGAAVALMVPGVYDRLVRTVALDISVLLSDSRFRGIGRYAHDLARGLSATANGDTLQVVGLHVASWSGRAAVDEDLAAAANALADVDLPFLPHSRWARRQRLMLARAVRSSGAALVHTPHPEATPIGRLGCPRVTTCHDLIACRYPELYTGWRDGYGPGRRWLDRRRYRTADHVIAVSEATAHDLMQIVELPASKITVVHNGVDLSQWSPTAEPDDAAVLERLGLADHPYLIYVGAGDWRKNAVGMLAALARARRRPGGSELMLVWAGMLNTRWRQQIEDTADGLGVQHAVRLLGFVGDDELGVLYRAAVANLFVSRIEGFGYPVLEAMASGCPVIASNCSSTAEIATGAAATVDPDDHRAIAEAITSLLDSGQERRRLRDAGLQRARHFSVERMATATREVYRATIG